MVKCWSVTIKSVGGGIAWSCQTRTRRADDMASPTEEGGNSVTRPSAKSVWVGLTRAATALVGSAGTQVFWQQLEWNAAFDIGSGVFVETAFLAQHERWDCAFASDLPQQERSEAAQHFPPQQQPAEFVEFPRQK